MDREYKRMLKKFFRNPSGLFGFALLVFFVLVALFAPFIAPPQPSNKHEPYMMPIVTWSSEPQHRPKSIPSACVDGEIYSMEWCGEHEPPSG